MAVVTPGKPKIGGAVSKAPLGTALPTDATTALNVAFKSLGYISNDGLVNSNSPTTESIVAWGGNVVAEINNEKEDRFEFTLLESTDLEVLKTVYGEDNVTGALATGITINAKNFESEYACFAIDMIYQGGILKRIVIPKGKVVSVGDITYKDDEAVAYPITISAVEDTAGNTHYEYIKQGA